MVLDGIEFREFLDSIAKSLCISEFAICAKASPIIWFDNAMFTRPRSRV